MDLGRLGRGIRALRLRRAWRQSDLAEVARVSRAQVGRIERGEAGRVPAADIEAVAAALGATVDLRLRWQGEALDRLLDEAHARLVEWTVRLLRSLGWEVAVEVSFSRYGERGSIDVLAFHPSTRALAVFEVKSVTPDMQAMLAGIDRKGAAGTGDRPRARLGRGHGRADRRALGHADEPSPAGRARGDGPGDAAGFDAGGQAMARRAAAIRGRGRAVRVNCQRGGPQPRPAPSRTAPACGHEHGRPPRFRQRSTP